MTTSTIRQALRKPRLFFVVGAAIALEFAIRLALGRGIHPFLYLLTPPVAGVAWFHLAATISRDTDTGDDRTLFANAPSGTLPSVLFLAVVGHAFAVIIGTALFFAIDTPIQAAIYWHVGHFRSPFFMFFWPVAGLLLGTSIAWILPALVLPGVRNGHSVKESLRRSIRTIRLWEFGKLVGTHLLVSIGLVITALIVGVVGVYHTSIPFVGLMLGLIPAFIIILFLTIPVTAAAVGHQQFSRDITSVDGNSGGISESANDAVGEQTGANSSEPTQNQSLLSIAVVIVLLLALGTLGGVARIAELQPAPSTEELGSTPDEMYASAVNNTVSGSYSSVIVFHGRDGGEDARVRLSVDESDRQTFVRGDLYFTYVSTIVQFRGPMNDEYSETPLHNLLSVTNIRNHFGPHSPGNYYRMIKGLNPLRDEDRNTRITGWEIVRESEEEIILSLTNVTAAASLAGADRTTENTQFDVQARIDPEDQRLQTLEVFYDTNSTSDDYDEVYDMRMTFDHDVDVQRPDSLGSPSIEEYVWRALIY